MRGFVFSLAALALCCWGMFAAGPSASPAYSAYGDSLNLYILRALHSPKALAADPAAAVFRSYASEPSIREYPYFGIYGLAQRVLSLNAAMKAFSLLLALATALLLLRICRLAMSARDAPWAAAMALLLLLSMDTFYFGQNRTFGVAIYAAWLLAALAGEGWLSPLFALALFSFYPYLTAAVLAYSALYAVTERGGGRHRALVFAALVLLAGTCMLLLSPGPDGARNNAAIFAYKLTGVFGERISPLNPLQSLAYFVLNLNEQGPLFWALQLAALAGAIASRRALAEAPSFARRLALLGAAHAAAFLALYPLSPFFASRQVIFFVPLASALLAALALARAGHAALKWTVLAAAALFCASHPFTGDIMDLSPYRGIYAELSDRREALVAGPPKSWVMASLPLYTGAAVFYNSHTAETWAGRAPGLNLSGREDELNAALCSPSSGPLLAFARKNKVTHFLSDSSYYRTACRGGAAALETAALRRGAPDATDGGRALYLLTTQEVADNAR